MPNPGRSIDAVSLNLARETNPGRILDALHGTPRLRSADVFLLQEVFQEDGKPSVAEETARKLGYYVSFAPAAPGVYDQGLALISRYPLDDVRITRLKRCDLGSRTRNRFAIVATVQTPWGGLRVWNAHLDTRINAGERLEQLQPVIDDASQHSGPGLIGGDFNTNDMYWLRNTFPLPGGPPHGVAIRSAMRQHGFETPFPDSLSTYPALRRHLDWIYVRDLDAVETSVEPAAFSDHNAIWVRLGL